MTDARWTPRRPSRALAAAALIVSCLIPGTVWSQTEPRRLALKAGADTNDWNPYFDLGIEKLRRHPVDAAASFSWASRLAPNRAEPLYARWVADPYYSLGKALEATGADHQAVAGYRMFVARAPRSTVMLSTAQGRIRALTPP